MEHAQQASSSVQCQDGVAEHCLAASGGVPVDQGGMDAGDGCSMFRAAGCMCVSIYHMRDTYCRLAYVAHRHAEKHSLACSWWHRSANFFTSRVDKSSASSCNISWVLMHADRSTQAAWWLSNRITMSILHQSVLQRCGQQQMRQNCGVIVVISSKRPVSHAQPAPSTTCRPTDMVHSAC